MFFVATLVTVFLVFTMQSVANETTVNIENTTLQNEEKLTTLRKNVTFYLKKHLKSENPSTDNLRISAIIVSAILLILAAIALLSIYIPYYNERTRELAKRTYEVTTDETLEMADVRPETVDVGVGTDPDCDCQQSYCGRCTINLLVEARKCYEKDMPKRPFIY